MSDTDTRSVAFKALDMGKANTLAIEAHEDLCAERYANINTTVGDVKASVKEIKALLGWVGAAFFTVMVSGMGYLISLTISANHDAAAAAAAKIEMLQRQSPPVQVQR